MRKNRLGLIHTSAMLVPIFARLCREKIPLVEDPTTDLIRHRAERSGRTIELTARMAEGAFDAQASMARVVDSLAAEDRTVPILSSPGLAMDHLAAMFGAL